jgi:hypothetical protein
MTKLDEEQREYLEAIRSSAEMLLRVSKDMLEYSLLGSEEEEESDCVQFSLRKTLHMIVQPFRHMAARKGVALGYSVDFDVPDRLVGDPPRLGRLLINLIGNAIQFTDSGEIKVNVERAESKDDSVQVEFTVSDTGIGISGDKIQQIFEPYFQVARGGTQSTSGVGLGLAIATRLAESLQGRLWVESEPGEGSRFHFTGRFELAQAPVCRAMGAAG